MGYAMLSNHLEVLQVQDYIKAAALQKRNQNFHRPKYRYGHRFGRTKNMKQACQRARR